MIVFFCTGLWHGANWTFVLWGLYHGMFLLVEEVVPVKKLPRILGHIYNIVIVTVGFVVFRADTISQGVGMIRRMFFGCEFSGDLMNVALRYCTPLLIFVVIIGFFGAFSWKRCAENYLMRKSSSVQNSVEVGTYVAVIGLLLFCMLSLSSGTYNPFIYFRF